MAVVLLHLSSLSILYHDTCLWCGQATLTLQHKTLNGVMPVLLQGKLKVEARSRVGAETLLLQVTKPGWHAAYWLLPAEELQQALERSAMARPAVVIDTVENNGEPARDPKNMLTFSEPGHLPARHFSATEAGMPC